MHELALMESMVEAVEDRVGRPRVAVVRLEIGQLAGVAIDALRFCFDVCARGHALEGATLDIVEIAGAAGAAAATPSARCRSLVTPCACGSFES